VLGEMGTCVSVSFFVYILVIHRTYDCYPCYFSRCELDEYSSMVRASKLSPSPTALERNSRGQYRITKPKVGSRSIMPRVITLTPHQRRRLPIPVGEMPRGIVDTREPQIRSPGRGLRCDNAGDVYQKFEQECVLGIISRLISKDACYKR